MKLIKLKLYRVAYIRQSIEEEELIEADSFAEAEDLVKEQFKTCSNWRLKSISMWCMPTYRKSIKTINIEV